jgi:hypothetical protein
MAREFKQGGSRRLGIGENAPGHKECRKNWSKRNNEGKLEVLKRTCPHCHHPKIFKNDSGFKCCKCKRRFKRYLK